VLGEDAGKAEIETEYDTAGVGVVDDPWLAGREPLPQASAIAPIAASTKTTKTTAVQPLPPVRFCPAV
jgi:hypothetical protein